MKILVVHNHYGGYSGETSVMEAHAAILEHHGHKVMRYTRSSAELKKIRLGSVKAFFSGFYSSQSIKELTKIIADFKPELVHIHNLYPLISPAIIPHIKKASIPTVMTVHNYRLVCPNGLFYNRQGICERCAGGKEWNCIFSNCEESIPKSIGYALRNVWARIARYYVDNVDAFLCLTDFQIRKLVNSGFPKNRCYVVPNFIDVDKNDIPWKRDKRSGFLYIGRLNHQKGIDVLIKAASKSPEVTFRLIGYADEDFIDINRLPSNVRWLGVIDDEHKLQELRKAMAVIFASRSYEGFPMVFLESMQQGLPVIAPELAGYPEIIRNWQNGRLFAPQQADDLARVIKELHSDSKKAALLGCNGFKILKDEYSADVWYGKYIEIINHIIENK